MMSYATADTAHAQRSYLTVTQLTITFLYVYTYKIIFNYKAVISLQQKETNFFF